MEMVSTSRGLRGGLGRLASLGMQLVQAHGKVTARRLALTRGDASDGGKVRAGRLRDLRVGQARSFEVSHFFLPRRHVHAPILRRSVAHVNDLP